MGATMIHLDMLSHKFSLHSHQIGYQDTPLDSFVFNSQHTAMVDLDTSNYISLLLDLHMYSPSIAPRNIL